MSYFANPTDTPEDNAPGQDQFSDALGRRTLRAALTVVLGLGVGAVCLRVAGENGNPAWLILLVLASALLVVLMRYFEWGLIAFMGVAWIAIGTPEVAQGGSGTSQRLLVSQAGLLLLLALWLVQRLLSQKVSFVKAPTNVPVFLYLLVCLISTGVSMLFPNAAVLELSVKQYFQVNIIEILMRLLALGGLLMCADTLQGKSLRVAMVMVTVPGLLSFSEVLPLPTSMYMAFPQILAMAILAAYAIGDKTPTWKRVVFGAIALSIFGFYFIRGAQWVSGWLGGLVALSVITFYGRRPLFMAGLAAAAVIVLANFGYFYKNVYEDNFYGSGPTSDRSRQGQMGTFTNDRSRMLAASVRYANTFPLGIGLGNYRSYNSYFGRVDVWNTTTFTSAHGSYAQALSETGWPGLITLLVLLYASGRTVRGYWKRLPPGGDRNYLLGAWGGMVGIFVSSFNGDYMFPSYHNGGVGSFGACVYTWLLLGICIALGRERGLTSMGNLAPPHTESPLVAHPQAVGQSWNHVVTPVRPQAFGTWIRRERPVPPRPAASAPKATTPAKPTPSSPPKKAISTPPAPVFARPVEVERPINGLGSPRFEVPPDNAPREEK